ncbi:MAG: FAD:protein FMN transferase [Planctomycetes bacterium]|nr:FAD:protein FMN transferase [Planctomycetota bacterium]
MLVRLATEACGTRFELVLDGEDEPRARAAGEAALELVERCDQRFSVFRSDSLIARVNREAAERPVRLDPETYALLERCSALQRATSAAFDIAVGPLMRTFGFRRRVDEQRESEARGTFELDERTRAVRFTSRNTALDLGSVAKGYALELAARSLRDNGIACALVHGGTSSVVALGAPPGESGWRVQLGRESGAFVTLRDTALSFSAPRGRTVEFAGHEVGHIFDPRSGKPVPLEMQCAVVGASALDCDAWSTAALVLASRDVSWSALLPRELAFWVRGPSGDAQILGPCSVFESLSPRSSTPR